MLNVLAAVVKDAVRTFVQQKTSSGQVVNAR